MNNRKYLKERFIEQTVASAFILPFKSSQKDCRVKTDDPHYSEYLIFKS